MGFFGESFQTAVNLIIAMDPEVYTTVWTSLYISLWSTLLASLIGIPAGIGIGIGAVPFKSALTTILNTLMALPTVVVGLVVYALLSRQGPLGTMGLLFTPKAMVIGQTVLAVPIITNYTLGSMTAADKRILPTALTLGAGPFQGILQLVREESYGIMAAVIAGFGRVIAEVGVAMMLGGNIRGYTRTMTTAIAMETSKGEFAFGLALGLVLLTVAFAINLALNTLQAQR